MEKPMKTPWEMRHGTARSLAPHASRHKSREKDRTGGVTQRRARTVKGPRDGCGW